MLKLLVILGAFLKMGNQVLTPNGGFSTNDNPSYQSFSMLTDNDRNTGAF